MKAILIAALFFFSNKFSYGQNFAWAKHFEGTQNGRGNSIAVDISGNVYTTGYFTGTVDFDPGPGIFNLTQSSGGGAFISKLDASGNFIWAKQFESWNIVSFSIALDATGNVYTTGFFQQIADFDPGPGVFNLTNVLGSDVFVCKLDNIGNFIWAKQFGGINNIYLQGYDMAVDAMGNVFTTGHFEGVADFDPGPGVFNLSPVGFEDMFISKLDMNGNFIWVKQIKGASYETGYSIALDATGNIYATGYFGNTVDFDPGSSTYNLTAFGASDIFILKLDPAGSFLWAKQSGGTLSDFGISISCDASGAIYTTGYFTGTGDFDPGSGVFNLISAGNIDIFLLKLDANGNFIWAKQMGGGLYDRGHDITFSVSGDVYLTGDFQGLADFDPGPGVLNFTSSGEADIFILKLDVNGNLIWAIQLGGTGDDISYSLRADASDNIYSTGLFNQTVDFDPGASVFNLVSLGTDNSYVHKISRCSNASFSTITALVCFFYTLNSQTYTSSGVYTQTLINAAGCDSIITLDLTINGSNDTLNAVACDSYTWRNQIFTSSGFYRDTLTGVSGCDSILNLNLIIKSSVLFDINVTICQGQNYFGYTTSGVYVDIYAATNGCDSVRTLNLLVIPKTFSSLNVIICEGQDYLGHFVGGTYIDTLVSANGCDSIRTLNLVVNIKKFTAINASICQGQSYFTGGVNQTTTGIYKDTLLTQFGCDSIVTTNLVVNPKPIPNLGQDKNLCLGKSLTLNPGIFTTYQWHDFSTSPNFVATNSGTYWVTVTDNNSCSARDTIKILNVFLPPSNFLKAVDSVCQYNQLHIRAVKNYENYLWSTGSVDFFINVKTPGQYTLTVTDLNGCVGSDTIQVYSKQCFTGVFIPTAFTPNYDNLNDVFLAKVYGSVIYFSLEVYDRAGQVVFRTSDPQKGWNGLYGGIPSSTAVYVWQCSYQLEGGRPGFKKGTVTLIR